MSFEESLQERISRERPSHLRGRLSIGLLAGELEEYGVWGGEAKGSVGEGELSVPVACVAKAFTAAMLVEEAEARRIPLSASVASVLGPETAVQRSLLARVSLRQLLDHTHGLDGSRLREVPRLSGWIDSRALCEELAAGPALHEPGELYSYGNVGSWLAAAILEHICERTYEDLLAERILDPIGALRPEQRPRAGTVCPATGGQLALHARQFLAFVKTHIAARTSGNSASETAGRLDVMPGAPVPMPGWCLERGAGVGWKYFGGGWYGYDGVSRSASLRVRLRFEDRTGIVVLAEGRGAGIALARLFGRAYPELSPGSLPKVQPDGSPGAAVAEACAGRYVNRSKAVLVSVENGSSLRLTSSDFREAPSTVIETVLKPYFGRQYLPEPHARESFPVVEFIASGGRITHLWNGSQLLRRA